MDCAVLQNFKHQICPRPTRVKRGLVKRSPLVSCYRAIGAMGDCLVKVNSQDRDEASLKESERFIKR